MEARYSFEPMSLTGGQIPHHITCRGSLSNFFGGEPKKIRPFLMGQALSRVGYRMFPGEGAPHRLSALPPHSCHRDHRRQQCESKPEIHQFEQPHDR